ISGTVTRPAIVQNASVVVLNATGQNINRGSRVDPDSGAFQTQWLPPGAYTARAHAFDNKTQPSFSACAPRSLRSDIPGVCLTLAPDTNMPANLSTASTRGEAGRLQSLVPISSGLWGPNPPPPAAHINPIPQDPIFSPMRHGSVPAQNADSGS